MPVPQKTCVVSCLAAKRPSNSRTTVNIADIYNKVERSKYQANTPPWRSFRHVTFPRQQQERKRDRSPRVPLDTQSLPDCSVFRQTPPDSTRARPNTAFDVVLSQLTFSPRPGENMDNDGADAEEGCRCLSRSEAGEFVLHGSEASDNGSWSSRPAYGHQRQQCKKDVSSFSQPARYAESRGFCARSRSALMRQDDGSVNDLSRQCCDVLGPKICHQCAIIRRRHRDTRRYESGLPKGDISEDNLTTALLVAKNYPDMSMEEILAKLSRGEILKPVFKYSLDRIKQRKRSEDQEETAVKLPVKAKLFRNANGATYNYFTSIKDLNEKILKGQLVRKIILSGDPEKDMMRRSAGDRDELQSFSETINPAFISPRKVKFDKRRDQVYYEPPLVPKLCQNNQSLHSGSQQAFSTDSQS